MSLEFFENVKGFYMIGIGGVSMSALAEYLLFKGARVSGSDSCPNERTERLKEMGALVCFPQAAENITDENVVVYSSAIPKDNPEYETALKRGKLLLSRAEFLNLVGKNFPHAIYVAGCHGKTTATAMIAHIFAAAGKRFTLHLGGDDLFFGNFYAGGDEFFISEACEYQKNILKLYGETAVLLNTELDHGECYASDRELEETYLEFLSRAEHQIVLHGIRAKDALSFSFLRGDYTAGDLLSEGERYRFTILERGRALCRVTLNVFGKHNVLNALAACAVARRYGISGDAIRAGLESFSGVRRRFERTGSYRGATIVCDYAHHPTEIAASVAIAEKIAEGRLFILFQPHTYSRTVLLFSGFVEALRGKNALVFQTYAAREKYFEQGDGRRLAKELCVPFADSVEGIKEFLSSVTRRDLILALGAGDIYEKMLSLSKESR